MNVREYMQSTKRRVSVETYKPATDTDSRRTFEVTVKLCGRAELERMRKSCLVEKWGKGPNGQRVKDEVPDLDKLRKFLATECLDGWQGLTWGTFASLCNADAPSDPAPTDTVPFSVENAQAVLEFALGFEDWLWETATRLADAREAGEAREKNG